MVNKLVSKAVSLGIVPEDDAEIYVYGLSDLFYTIFTWLVFIMLGACIHMFWFTVLFTLMYMPFRMYAGGLHFATRLRCFFASIVIFIVVFSAAYFIAPQLLSTIMLFLLLPSLIVVFWLAPVEDFRKPLNAAERKHHSKIALLICAIETVLAVVFYLLKLYLVSYFIGAAIAVISIQLLLGALKNKLTLQAIE